MKEKKLVKKLIEQASLLTTNNVKNGRPTTIIDKEEYAKYDFNILKAELEKLGYTLSELINAPEPYNSFNNFLKNKLIVYKL